MIGTTGIGWLYSLAKDPESNWGSVTDFYKSIDEFEIKNGKLIIVSKVWGKIQTKKYPMPNRGDGFAFYHSSSAVFPHLDRFKRKQRISLMGELLDIKFRPDGRTLHSIRVAIDPDILEAFRKKPIIRDDLTRNLFEKCGIVQGAVASLYRADKPTWKELNKLIFNLPPPFRVGGLE